MKQWYLLHCKRGEQQRAKLHLENQNVECFYPEVDVEKIFRGKRVISKQPLFPGYIFVYFDCDIGPSFTTVRSTRGVNDFVRLGAHPHVVRESIISSIKMYDVQEVIGEGLPILGQSIEIKSGPYAGIDAIYKEPDGEKRSILLITLINQQVEIKIENANMKF